jgi:hypothetical protein
VSRFVVAADKLTSQQQDAITEIVQRNGWEFWHWYEGLWLLAGVEDDRSARNIHAELNEDPMLDGRNILVIKIGERITYWGRAPQESWRWMQQFWGTAD